MITITGIGDQNPEISDHHAGFGDHDRPESAITMLRNTHRIGTAGRRPEARPSNTSTDRPRIGGFLDLEPRRCSGRRRDYVPRAHFPTIPPHRDRTPSQRDQGPAWERA